MFLWIYLAKTGSICLIRFLMGNLMGKTSGSILKQDNFPLKLNINAHSIFSALYSDARFYIHYYWMRYLNKKSTMISKLASTTSQEIDSFRPWLLVEKKKKTKCKLWIYMPTSSAMNLNHILLYLLRLFRNTAVELLFMFMTSASFVKIFFQTLILIHFLYRIIFVLLTKWTQT